jgi:hypothetical protein
MQYYHVEEVMQCSSFTIERGVDLRLTSVNSCTMFVDLRWSHQLFPLQSLLIYVFIYALINIFSCKHSSSVARTC